MFAVSSPPSSRNQLDALARGSSDCDPVQLSRDARDMSSALERIEHRIAEVEREITAIAPLVHERTRLLRARAVLRGDPEPNPREPALRPRVTRADVFSYLTRNPGSRAGEVAAGLVVGQSAVSAHLYRGKGRLFTSRGGRWYPVPAADELASGVG